MEGHEGGNQPWQPGASPRGPRHSSPMQYFTSGSNQGYQQAQPGASPRFSTPRPHRYPPRVQGHYNSPYPNQGTNRYGSPYGSGGGNRPLEYTPSPVRPRHNVGQYHDSPNTPHYGRGGNSSFRGGRGGRVSERFAMKHFSSWNLRKYLCIHSFCIFWNMLN